MKLIEKINQNIFLNKENSKMLGNEFFKMAHDFLEAELCKEDDLQIMVAYILKKIGFDNLQSLEQLKPDVGKSVTKLLSLSNFISQIETYLNNQIEAIQYNGDNLLEILMLYQSTNFKTLNIKCQTSKLLHHSITLGNNIPKNLKSNVIIPLFNDKYKKGAYTQEILKEMGEIFFKAAFNEDFFEFQLKKQFFEDFEKMVISNYPIDILVQIALKMSLQNTPILDFIKKYVFLDFNKFNKTTNITLGKSAD